MTTEQYNIVQTYHDLKEMGKDHKVMDENTENENTENSIRKYFYKNVKKTKLF